jgi:hypothetical protein
VIGVGVERVAESILSTTPFAISFISIAAHPYRLVASARHLFAERAALAAGCSPSPTGRAIGQ